MSTGGEFGCTNGESGSRNFLVCGISFRRTPIEIREKLSIPAAMLGAALEHLSDQPGVRECMILSTCNRTELYLSGEEWLEARELFLRFSAAMRGFDLRPFADQVFVLRGADAAAHLFRVASSVDSLVVGEPQILGQAKAAFREAKVCGCVGRELHRLVPRAFAAAKEVRSETGICEAAVSIPYAAVQLAGKIFEELKGRSVLLLGAGRMGELAALHLKEAGASPIYVTNRTPARAEEVAGKCSGKAVEFERRAKALAVADVVICSTDAEGFVLDEHVVRNVLRVRPRRPLLILDISVPRNVDPLVSGIDGAYLFNVDDLESVVRANLRSREAEADRAEEVLERALARFFRDESRASVAPAIAAIRGQVRSVCRAELLRLEQRAPGLSPETLRELEVMVHRIAQKIAHPAIMELKSGASREAAEGAPGLIERLFGVEREAGVL